jgi:hypothetical protein
MTLLFQSPKSAQYHLLLQLFLSMLLWAEPLLYNYEVGERGTAAWRSAGSH